MKKNFILFIVFLLGTIAAAHAIPYTDEFDAKGILMRSSLFGTKDTKSWIFDITTDAIGNPWFNPETQDVTSATIHLKLRDNTGCDFWEFAYLDVGDNIFLWEVDAGNTSFTLSSLMTLSDTGKVNATLTAIWGDFYFDSALLKAEGTLPPDLVTSTSSSPVPEPATILLFGTGLASLTLAARRRLFDRN